MTLQHQIDEFLDKLKDTGQTNMVGAIPYLLEEFPVLTQEEARKYLHYWMEHY